MMGLPLTGTRLCAQFALTEMALVRPQVESLQPASLMPATPEAIDLKQNLSFIAGSFEHRP